MVGGGGWWWWWLHLNLEGDEGGLGVLQLQLLVEHGLSHVHHHLLQLRLHLLARRVGPLRRLGRRPKHLVHFGLGLTRTVVVIMVVDVDGVVAVAVAVVVMVMVVAAMMVVLRTGST
jgi:hypothetical protein